MASIHYYLEKRKGMSGQVRKNNVPILLYFSFEGKRLQLNTGERIDFSDWDFQHQMALEDRIGAKQLNRYLNSLSGEIMDIYREAKSIGFNPGVDYIRKQLKYRRRKGQIRFFDVYMRFIDQNYSHWSMYTFLKIKTHYNHMVEFAEAEGTDIDFNRIDRNFLDRYVRFFKIRYGHTNNTIASNLDILKWFLNWASDQGYNKSVLYRDYRFNWTRKPRLAQADLVLSWDQLDRLRLLDPVERTMADVRDIFCFMCFTGMRLSLVNQLKSGDIFPSYISIPVNEHFREMPINEYASRIAGRHLERSRDDGRCFPQFRNPDFNRHLKQLGKLAGINEFVSINIYSGQEKGTQQVRKFEVLSSKVAVNTFIFNALRLNVAPQAISFITGSKSMSGIDRIRPLVQQLAYSDIQKFNTLPTGEPGRTASG